MAKKIVLNVTGGETNRPYRIVKWTNVPQAYGGPFFCVEAFGHATDGHDGWDDLGPEFDTVEEAKKFIDKFDSDSDLALREKRSGQ